MPGNIEEMELLEAFCRSLPKLELHAHLNGSLSPTTLKKLHQIQNPDGGQGDGEWKEWQRLPEIQSQNPLKACFELFSIAHKLTCAPEYVRVATEDVIKEFHDDNVIYLELRSTPRAVDATMSKREYVLAIIDGMITSEVEYPKIMVKLLISVDRKRGYEDARENMQLAIELKKQYAKYVVGLDLSGDPTTGGAFIELLDSCRKAGLKIAAHCAEVPNRTEVVDMLNFKPDRLGHCTCIHPSLNGSEELFEMLLRSRIPNYARHPMYNVEPCPITNPISLNIYIKLVTRFLYLQTTKGFSRHLCPRNTSIWVNISASKRASCGESPDPRSATLLQPRKKIRNCQSSSMPTDYQRCYR